MSSDTYSDGWAVADTAQNFIADFLVRCYTKMWEQLRDCILHVALNIQAQSLGLICFGCGKSKCSIIPDRQQQPHMYKKFLELASIFTFSLASTKVMPCRDRYICPLFHGQWTIICSLEAWLLWMIRFHTRIRRNPQVLHKICALPLNIGLLWWLKTWRMRFHLE